MTTGVASIADRSEDGGAARAVERARQAQAAWGATPVSRRLRLVRRARRAIARRHEELAAAVGRPSRRSVAETLSAELLPLAEACRFLERHARELLEPRPLSGRGPLWLGGVAVEQRREPLGVVLVIGPSNYPLFLPGAQAIQALVAGNAVVLKPGAGGAAAAVTLAAVLREAGLAGGLLNVVGESELAARRAIDAGVDKVVLTGSADTGRAVLARLAPRLTPATMELSGCDAMFVRADADLELVIRALCFGLTLNAGATCIAPRRVFVARELGADLERRLADALSSLPAVELDAASSLRLGVAVSEALAAGARRVGGAPPAGDRVRPLALAGATPEMSLCRSDLMAPVAALIEVADDDEALALAERCPYALGASVFSRGEGGRELAARVRAGVVVINDVIAPTADPRVAFGGRGDSGFGLTRGAEGLLEMTSLKTLVSRRGSWRPHLERHRAGRERLLAALLRLLHGGPRERWRALGALVAGARRKSDEPTHEP